MWWAAPAVRGAGRGDGVKVHAVAEGGKLIYTCPVAAWEPFFNRARFFASIFTTLAHLLTHKLPHLDKLQTCACAEEADTSLATNAAQCECLPCAPY